VSHSTEQLSDESEWVIPFHPNKCGPAYWFR
jgi:hypothetical protein